MTLSPDFPPPLPEVADQDMELLDIHTHRTPPPADALLSVTLPLPPDATLDRLSDGSPVALGLHPWKTAGFNTPEEASTLLAELADLAATPQVIAIGEAGLDPLRGAPLPVQESVFRSQIAISETTGKPLIIHLVRAWDQFLKIRRDTAPRQPWILHGFRGKPRVLEMLLRERHDAPFQPRLTSPHPCGPSANRDRRLPRGNRRCPRLSLLHPRYNSRQPPPPARRQLPPPLPHPSSINYPRGHCNSK